MKLIQYAGFVCLVPLVSAILGCSHAAPKLADKSLFNRHPAGARGSEAGDCKDLNGDAIGKRVATCNAVQKGRSADSLFEVKAGHFCISQLTQSMDESSDEIVTYVGIDWKGAYVGTSTSSDHLLPSTSFDHAFSPNEPADFSTSSQYYSLPSGAPTARYGIGATLDARGIAIDNTAVDGAGSRTFNYRTKLDYDSSAKRLSIQYWRESSTGFFGLGATWEKLYDVSLSCQ